jgi:glycosyltransferase involved in cell wall biosynthesis
MTRVLIIGYVWPEPASSAAGGRMMQLIRLFLEQRWAVTFASAALPSSHMADIEAMGVDKVCVELNSSTFDRFVAGLQPDLVLFDRFMIEEQFGWRVARHCPNALRVLDTEDLHCLRAARQQALKAGKTLSAHELNSELAMREVAAILRCDLSLIISSYEMELLHDHYRVAEALLLHLPFMLPRLSPDTLAGFSDREGYISIGNFRHAPNWDAVLYLKKQLWPLIRQQDHRAQLYVYGAYPPRKATQLHNEAQGFHVKGWADDAFAVISRARVCLAPLRFGAGLKGKLVDAMSCGTPSVTTSIGAEAMHEGLPWGGIVADEPGHFVAAALQLHDDEACWQQAQANGVAIINRLYLADELADRLLSRLQDLSANLCGHRLENFVGGMLQHHRLQSTRYMAQWIEAKNRKLDG